MVTVIYLSGLCCDSLGNLLMKDLLRLTRRREAHPLLARREREGRGINRPFSGAQMSALI